MRQAGRDYQKILERQGKIISGIPCCEAFEYKVNLLPVVGMVGYQLFKGFTMHKVIYVLYRKGINFSGFSVVRVGQRLLKLKMV